MGKDLPRIDKAKLLTTDNVGIALTRELAQWFEDVVDILNYLIQKSNFKDIETRQHLADIILAINHQQHPSPNCEECKNGGHRL